VANISKIVYSLNPHRGTDPTGTQNPEETAAPKVEIFSHRVDKANALHPGTNLRAK
jgi:hypothetical protein